MPRLTVILGGLRKLNTFGVDDDRGQTTSVPLTANGMTGAFDIAAKRPARVLPWMVERFTPKG